jgi:GWxTD domain-containing protein
MMFMGLSCRNRRTFRAAAPILLAALVACSAAAQVDLSADRSQPSTSLVFEALSFSAGQADQPDKARLDLFIQVGYDNLTFLKEGDQYQASYELTTVILDSARNQINDVTWRDEVRGLTYDESVASGAAKISTRSFLLNPGKYSVQIMLRDNENREDKKVSREILIPPYGHRQFSLSGAMLVARISRQEGRTSITPLVSSNVGSLADSFAVFFEAYNNGRADSVRFHAGLTDKKDEEVLGTDTAIVCPAGRSGLIMTLHHASLPLGDYKLVVRAARVRDSEPLALSTRPVIVRWRGMPFSTNSLDAAIDQLKYIARSAELDSMKEASTTEEKARLFHEFWKKRDPNPNTPRNERMEMYYSRIDYANKHFSKYREGWRTDMGMVFIIWGPPSNVERHPFEMDSKPYEIWSYYDYNQVFVFVDENGFGDYRLITPLLEPPRRLW